MTLERMEKFSEREQLLIMASEFERARIWEGDRNSEAFKGALWRALDIIDTLLQCRQWQTKRIQLWHIRDETVKFYVGKHFGSVARLWQAL